MATITTGRDRSRDHGPHAPTEITDDGADFSRSLIIGVAYGLIAWFHIVLCPGYVVAGLLDAQAMRGYPVGPEVWAATYVVTGLLMVTVAIGLVARRPLAWRIAPWAVLPNLVVHLLFIGVMPLWGLTAIGCDILAIWLVVGERRRHRVNADRKIRPKLAQGHASRQRRAPQMLGNRRPT